MPMLLRALLRSTIRPLALARCKGASPAFSNHASSARQSGCPPPIGHGKLLLGWLCSLVCLQLATCIYPLTEGNFLLDGCFTEAAACHSLALARHCSAVSLSLGSPAWAVSAQRPPFPLGALAPDSDIHILLPHIVSAPHPVNQTRQEVGRCQGAHFPHSKREAAVQIHPQQGARFCWAISDGQCRAVVGWSGFGNVQAESDPADWGRENTRDKESQGQ